MRALVTGAAGFVGGHLAEAPVAAGHGVAGADAVFHLAGQPGVRSSWAEGFREAQDHDVLAASRSLEAVRRAPPRRFALASSSSPYGTCGPAPAVGLEEGLASQVARHRGLGRAA